MVLYPSSNVTLTMSGQHFRIMFVNPCSLSTVEASHHPNHQQYRLWSKRGFRTQLLNKRTYALSLWILQKCFFHSSTISLKLVSISPPWLKTTWARSFFLLLRHWGVWKDIFGVFKLHPCTSFHLYNCLHCGISVLSLPFSCLRRPLCKHCPEKLQLDNLPHHRCPRAMAMTGTKCLLVIVLCDGRNDWGLEHGPFRLNAPNLIQHEGEGFLEPSGKHVKQTN